MKFSVPFLPDHHYTAFIKQQSAHIQSVYFALDQGPVLDARMRLNHTKTAAINRLLTDLGPIEKYCLLNSRFIHPSLYHDHQFLDHLLDQLSFLYAHNNLNGFVFSDAYLLTALSTRKNKTACQMEAVPGINCMIDSFQKAASFLEIIDDSGFLAPRKILLDRSLNRDLTQLQTVVTQIKANHPGMTIELLANEGCMLHCPYKLAHDAHISLANLSDQKNLTHLINQTIGCHTYFFNHPKRFLKSPFIRPEDLAAYSETVDSIKLCGRTLGPRFLTNVINAYINRSYPDNLLHLMDATHWLSDHYHIDNKKLDPGFLKMVTQCKIDCAVCDGCSELFQYSAKNKPVGLKHFKDIQ
jgi:hypothetical protein